MNDNLEKDTLLTDSELEELLDEDDLDNVAGAGSITRPPQSGDIGRDTPFLF